MKPVKNKYVTEFVESLQRKAMFVQPLFLSHNEMNLKNISGGNNDIILPLAVKFNPVLFQNIYFYAKKDLMTFRIISPILRRIFLGNDKEINFEGHFVKDEIIELYSVLSNETKLNLKTNLHLFPPNIFELVKSNPKNIIIIDFDVLNEEQLQIASVLKQIFFGYKGSITNISKSELIKFMNGKKYKLQKEINAETPGQIVKHFGLLFSL